MKTADRVCAWCKTKLGEIEDRCKLATEGLPTEGPRVSHGFCRACFEAFMAQIRALPAIPEEVNNA